MSSSPAMDRLVASLKRLPGIGEKSATRLAYFLLSAPAELSHELSESIARLQRDTVVCETCFTLADRSPCSVCAHPERDRTLICVVEEPADMAAMCDAWLAGNVAEARRFHYKTLPLSKVLFIETNPVPVKEACAMMGFCRPDLRLPLTRLEPANLERLRSALVAYGLV